MLKVAIIIGSTRPQPVTEPVARSVYDIAQRRRDAEFELLDIKRFNLPLLDERCHLPLVGTPNRTPTPSIISTMSGGTKGSVRRVTCEESAAILMVSHG